MGWAVGRCGPNALPSTVDGWAQYERPRRETQIGMYAEVGSFIHLTAYMVSVALEVLPFMHQEIFVCFKFRWTGTMR